jgi:hypothetical protein
VLILLLLDLIEGGVLICRSLTSLSDSVNLLYRDKVVTGRSMGRRLGGVRPAPT